MQNLRLVFFIAVLIVLNQFNITSSALHNVIKLKDDAENWNWFFSWLC